MSEIRMHDTRDPVVAGEEIYQDALAGRNVVADPLALVWALDQAVSDLGTQWDHLAEAMHQAVHATRDSVAGTQALAARQDVARVTEIAYSLLAVLSEHTTSIVEGEKDFDRSPHGDGHDTAEVS
jgi:hypothetical protein